MKVGEFVAVRVGVLEGVGVEVGECVAVAVDVLVAVAVGVEVLEVVAVGVEVLVAVAVGVEVLVAVAVGVEVLVVVAVAVKVLVAVAVAVEVFDAVGDEVAEAVGVWDGEGVEVEVSVLDAAGVAVAVLEGVRVTVGGFVAVGEEVGVAVEGRLVSPAGAMDGPTFVLGVCRLPWTAGGPFGVVIAGVSASVAGDAGVSSDGVPVLAPAALGDPAATGLETTGGVAGTGVASAVCVAGGWTTRGVSVGESRIAGSAVRSMSIAGDPAKSGVAASLVTRSIANWVSTLGLTVTTNSVRGPLERVSKRARRRLPSSAAAATIAFVRFN